MRAIQDILFGAVMAVFGLSMVVVTGMIDVNVNPRVEVIELPTPQVPADYVPPSGFQPQPEYQLPPSIQVYSDEDFEWMRKNIYFESRNQGFEDMIAVGFVVMNRVADSRYPDTVKDVVTRARRDANGAPIKNKCHFSWYCDGRADRPDLNNTIERQAWDAAGRAAHIVLSGAVEDPTNGAVYYHAPSVMPHWVQKAGYVTKSAQIGHIFYTRT